MRSIACKYYCDILMYAVGNVNWLSIPPWEQYIFYYVFFNVSTIFYTSLSSAYCNMHTHLPEPTALVAPAPCFLIIKSWALKLSIDESSEKREEAEIWSNHQLDPMFNFATRQPGTRDDDGLLRQRSSLLSNYGSKFHCHAITIGLLSSLFDDIRVSWLCILGAHIYGSWRLTVIYQSYINLQALAATCIKDPLKTYFFFVPLQWGNSILYSYHIYRQIFRYFHAWNWKCFSDYPVIPVS